MQRAGQQVTHAKYDRVDTSWLHAGFGHPSGNVGPEQEACHAVEQIEQGGNT